MMNNASVPCDAVALVRRLDAAAIHERLDDLDRERSALLVLLRAARRAQRSDSSRKPAEGAHG
jgi:hypothetical protein